MPRTLIVFLLMLMVSVSCDPQAGSVAPEPHWGVGAKADDGSCPEGADLCWSSVDTLLMQDIQETLRAMDLGEAGEQETLVKITRRLRTGFQHRLDPDQDAALGALQAELIDLGSGANDELLARIRQDLHDVVLDRLTACYYVAYLALAGRRADTHNLPEGIKADDGSESFLESLYDFNYTEDMSESLRTMKQSCALGQAYAILLEVSGVLRPTYPVITRENFFTRDPETGRMLPAGPSREERVKRIIRKYGWIALGVGAGVGLIRLIPIAGVPLSIATEILTLFPLHARMIFEIAGVYGMDISKGPNLLTAALIQVNGELSRETADHLAIARLTEIFGDAMIKRMGLVGKAYGVTFAGGLSLKVVISFLEKKSGKLLAKIAGPRAGQVGPKVLAWAARIMSVLAASAIDWFITDQIGKRAAVSSRHWLHDLPMDGTSFLAGQGPRDCAFRTLGAMAWADGQLNEREAKLFVAMLAKPYYLGSESWYFLRSSERIVHASTLHLFSELPSARPETLTCTERYFEDLRSREKVEYLALVYSMMQIDQEEDPEELEFYTRLGSLLDGQGFWDGPAIVAEQLDFAERSVYILLNPATINEYLDEPIPELASIRPEDTLDFMYEPDPEAMQDFICGFEGVCSTD